MFNIKIHHLVLIIIAVKRNVSISGLLQVLKNFKTYKKEDQKKKPNNILFHYSNMLRRFHILGFSLSTIRNFVRKQLFKSLDLQIMHSRSTENSDKMTLYLFMEILVESQANRKHQLLYLG